MPAQTSNPQTRLPSSGRTFKHKPDIFRRRMQAQTAPDPTFSDKTLQFRQPRPQTSHQNSDWTSQARPDSRKHDIPAQTRRLQTGSSSSGRTATVSDQISKVRPHPNSDSTNSIAHPTVDHRHEPCRVGCWAMPVGWEGGSVMRGLSPTGMHRTSKQVTMSKSIDNAKTSRCQGGGRQTEPSHDKCKQTSKGGAHLEPYFV